MIMSKSSIVGASGAICGIIGALSFYFRWDNGPMMLVMGGVAIFLGFISFMMGSRSLGIVAIIAGVWSSAPMIYVFSYFALGYSR